MGGGPAKGRRGSAAFSIPDHLLRRSTAPGSANNRHAPPQRRPAKVGDKLVTREFIDTLIRGFASPEDLDVAVCVLPGTELSFSDNVRRIRLWPWSKNVIHHKTAIFRQVNRGDPNDHHDALEFPDGQIVLLTLLKAGQKATVLQLPATAVVGSKLPQPLTYVPLPTTIRQ